MKIETVEEYLKRGGKITKIEKPDYEKIPSFFITQKARQESYKRKKESLKNGAT